VVSDQKENNMRHILPALAVLVLASAAGADTSAEARAKVVAPFLDPQTLGVVRIDIDRLEPEALGKRLAAILKRDEEEIAREAKELAGLKKQLAEAGAKEVYVVISLADLPQSTLVVVPLAVGKDEKPLAEILRPLGFAGLERRGDAVAAGSEATLQRLRDLKPDPRPDLAKAFEALGEPSDVEFVLLPPAALRKSIQELIPTLPADVGGGSSKVLTDGLRWAAVRLKLKPKIEVEVIVQSKDAATARSQRDLARRVLDEAAKQEDVKKVLPKVEKLVPLLTPSLDGDRLSVKITEEQVAAVEALEGVVDAQKRAAERARSTNNLRQLGLALHTYHDMDGAFPAAASYSKDGKPLLSWRVHILPYIEQDQLYKQFKLDEPWDSEHNKKLIAKMPAVYRTPGAKDRAGFTSYLGIAGTQAMFAGKKGVAIKDVIDGTSNTILLVEADDEHAVEWTKPVDLKFDAEKPLTGLRPAFSALFVDGSVHYFAKQPEAKVMKALFTRNGGEVVEVP
jgi:hypothetical protein